MLTLEGVFFLKFSDLGCYSTRIEEKAISCVHEKKKWGRGWDGRSRAGAGGGPQWCSRRTHGGHYFPSTERDVGFERRKKSKRRKKEKKTTITSSLLGLLLLTSGSAHHVRVPALDHIFCRFFLLLRRRLGRLPFYALSLTFKDGRTKRRTTPMSCTL